MKIKNLSESTEKTTGNGSSVGLNKPHKPPPPRLDFAEVLQIAVERCHQRRKRWTPHRRQILELLVHSEKPLSAYELLKQFNALTAHCHSPPIIYRALEGLIALGMVHRLEQRQQYIACRYPEHPHGGLLLICKECDSVAELPTEQINLALQQALSQHHFQAKQAFIEITGQCQQCNAQNAPAKY